MAAQSSPARVKAIAFDFDGTLADSFPLFVHAVEYALNREPFTAVEIESLRQHSVGEIMKILRVKKWKLPWLVAKGTREINRHQDGIRIFKGIPDVLQQLSQHGYKLYIVSSHSEKGMRAVLNRHKLSGSFDRIYGNLGLHGKPKGLKKLQSQFGYSPDECVYVGDEIRDVEAAAKTGVRCITVAWGFNGIESLKRHNPNGTVDKPLELVQALKNLS